MPSAWQHPRVPPNLSSMPHRSPLTSSSRKRTCLARTSHWSSSSQQWKMGSWPPWLQALCHPMPRCPLYLLETAAEQGQLDILQYLCASPSPPAWTTSVISAAVEHLDCLKWLLTEEPPSPWNDDLVVEVAAAHDLDVLKWLRSLSLIPLDLWTEEVTLRAVESKLHHLRTLDPPCPWGPSCTVECARRGRLDMLKWMRSQDPACPWTAATCAPATGHSSLDVLIFFSFPESSLSLELRLHGCSCLESPRIGRIAISSVTGSTMPLGTGLRRQGSEQGPLRHPLMDARSGPPLPLESTEHKLRCAWRQC